MFVYFAASHSDFAGMFGDAAHRPLFLINLNSSVINVNDILLGEQIVFGMKNVLSACKQDDRNNCTSFKLFQVEVCEDVVFCF